MRASSLLVSLVLLLSSLSLISSLSTPLSSATSSASLEDQGELIEWCSYSLNNPLFSAKCTEILSFLHPSSIFSASSPSSPTPLSLSAADQYIPAEIHLSYLNDPTSMAVTFVTAPPLSLSNSHCSLLYRILYSQSLCSLLLPFLL